MDEDLLLLREVLRGKNDIIKHQKKVIDRLSRKIQRLKQENNNLWIEHHSLNNVINFKTNYNANLVDRIYKAMTYIEVNKEWLETKHFREQLISILKGDLDV